MNIANKINFYRNMTTEEFIKNIKEYKKMTLQEINILFLNINPNLQKLMLDDEKLFNLIMSIPPNKMKKTILNLVDEDVLEYILKSNYLKESLHSKKMLLTYFDTLNYTKFSRIIDKCNITIEDLGINTIEKINKLSSRIKPNNNVNNLALLKIKNKYELYIYQKFNILLEVKMNKGNVLYIGNTNDIVTLNYDILININANHIIKLMNILKEKDHNYENHELFISVIKLYIIFGYDDTRKIINDFYTYATKSSIKRASIFLYKDKRREFRLNNQDKFYHYKQEDEILESINNNDPTPLKNILPNTDGKNINTYMKKLKEKIQNITSETEKRKIIKEYIIETINNREKNIEEEYIKKYINYYTSIERTNPLTTKEIYNKFKKINIRPNLSDKGKIINDEDLLKFLLGNRKKDNDCLLRMILNEEALGINKELYNIINNFDKIKEAINNNNKLSLNSLLDIIDITKVLLYKLKPDELDITLNTFSKLLNSRKYITEDIENVINRALSLHKERKKRISASFPIINGQIDNLEYEVANFYDESLLTDGIDDGSCFKVGGPGEEFFKYCLTNKNGGILHLYHNNIKYTLPFSKNGNMLNINSIDPRFTNQETTNIIINSLKQIANTWINYKDSPIEIVTITDIHIKEYLKELKLEQVNIKEVIPLNTNFYTDYNKNEVTNYIINKKNNKTVINYNNTNKLFYQKRKKPFIYNLTKEHDSERVELIINGIAYRSIEELDIPKEEKKELNNNYKTIKISNYKYIVGNIDWFIAIDKNNNIESYILSNDKRAEEEYNLFKDLIIKEKKRINIIRKKTK